MVTIRNLSYCSNIKHPLSSRTVTNMSKWMFTGTKSKTGKKQEKRFVQQISGKSSILETAVGDGNRAFW